MMDKGRDGYALCNRCNCMLTQHIPPSKQPHTGDGCTCGNCIGYQAGVQIDSYTGKVRR